MVVESLVKEVAVEQAWLAWIESLGVVDSARIQSLLLA
jgi:hypothetical protein